MRGIRCRRVLTVLATTGVVLGGCSHQDPEHGGTDHVTEVTEGNSDSPLDQEPTRQAPASAESAEVAPATANGAGPASTADGPTGTEQEQQQSAQGIALTYLDAVEDVSVDGADPAILHTLVTSVGPEARIIHSQHDPLAYQQVGRARFEPIRIDRSGDDELEVQICVDTTDITALGSDGKDYLDEDRRLRMLHTVTVRWHNGSWLVHEISNQGQPSC